MEHEEGFKFIKKAYEVENDEKLWDLYLINFRNMNKDNFISFNEYKEQVISRETIKENLSKQEIEEKVKRIIDITIKEGEK